jgi:hypothetical protein
MNHNLKEMDAAKDRAFIYSGFRVVPKWPVVGCSQLRIIFNDLTRHLSHRPINAQLGRNIHVLEEEIQKFVLVWNLQPVMTG